MFVNCQYNDDLYALCQEAVELVHWKIKVILVLPGLTARHEVVLSCWTDFFGLWLDQSRGLFPLHSQFGTAMHSRVSFWLWNSSESLLTSLTPGQVFGSKSLRKTTPSTLSWANSTPLREWEWCHEMSWIGFIWKGKAPAVWRNAGVSILRSLWSLWSLCFRMPQSQFVRAYLSYPITEYCWNCQIPANRHKIIQSNGQKIQIIPDLPQFMLCFPWLHGNGSDASWTHSSWMCCDNDIDFITFHVIFIRCPRRLDEILCEGSAALCIQATLWHKRMPLRRL